MNRAVFAVLVGFAVAGITRGGEKQDPERRQMLRHVNSVKQAIDAEKLKLAKVNEDYRARLAALEKERANARRDAAVKIDILAAKLKELETIMVRLKEAAPQKKVRPASIEEKLDLILKKLDDLEKRVQRLEGKKTGTLPDGVRR
jgi:hypothetical protein